MFASKKKGTRKKKVQPDTRDGDLDSRPITKNKKKPGAQEKRTYEPLTDDTFKKVVNDWLEIYGKDKDTKKKGKNFGRTMKGMKERWGPISQWDTSKVENMKYTFYNAKSFNQDIRMWNVSSVTNMSDMFKGAESFEQDISIWNAKINPDSIGMPMHKQPKRSIILHKSEDFNICYFSWLNTTSLKDQKTDLEKNKNNLERSKSQEINVKSSLRKNGEIFLDLGSLKKAEYHLNHYYIQPLTEEEKEKCVSQLWKSETYIKEIESNKLFIFPDQRKEYFKKFNGNYNIYKIHYTYQLKDYELPGNLMGNIKDELEEDIDSYRFLTEDSPEALKNRIENIEKYKKIHDDYIKSINERIGNTEVFYYNTDTHESSWAEPVRHEYFIQNIIEIKFTIKIEENLKEEKNVSCNAIFTGDASKFNVDKYFSIKLINNQTITFKNNEQYDGVTSSSITEIKPPIRVTCFRIRDLENYKTNSKDSTVNLRTYPGNRSSSREESQPRQSQPKVKTIVGRMIGNISYAQSDDSDSDSVDDRDEHYINPTNNKKHHVDSLDIDGILRRRDMKNVITPLKKKLNVEMDKLKNREKYIDEDIKIIDREIETVQKMIDFKGKVDNANGNLDGFKNTISDEDAKKIKDRTEKEIEHATKGIEDESEKQKIIDEILSKINMYHKSNSNISRGGKRTHKKRITKQRRKLTKKRITKNKRKNRTNKTKKRRFRHKRKNTVQI